MNKITKILMSTLMIFGLVSSISVINDVRHDYTTVEAAGETAYQHVFSTKPSVGTVTLSGITWTLTATNLNNYNSDYKGVQFGTSKFSGAINLRTDWSISETYSDIESIVLYVNAGSGTPSATVSVGGSTLSGVGSFSKQYQVSSWDKVSAVTYSTGDVKNGEIVIYLTCAKASYLAAVIINCSNSTSVNSVSLNKTSTSLEVGATETLRAKVDPDGSELLWESSNSSVASVSNNGVVTASEVGTTTIKVSAKADSTKYATCEVTVTKAQLAVQDAFASVITEAGLSFGYTETVTSSLNKSELKTTDAVESAKRIVIVSKLVDKYYAMNCTVVDNKSIFTGTEIALAADGSIDTVLSDGHLWDVEAGTGDNAEKIALKNVSTGEYLKSTTSTTLGTSTTASYLEASLNSRKGLYILLSGTDNTKRTPVYRGGTTNEFRAYSISNVNSDDYANSVHLFNYDGNETTTYTDFKNIKMKFRYSFDPSNYTGTVSEQGFVVSDNSEFDFTGGFYTTTGEDSLESYMAVYGKTVKVAKPADSTKSSFVIGINIPLDKLDYTFYVAAYIVVDGTYYFAKSINNGNGYSVETMLDTYSTTEGLTPDQKAVVEAFKAQFEA